MRWIAAAWLALFLALSSGLTAQVRGGVRAGSASGIHVGGTFSGPTVIPPGIHIGSTIARPPIGFGNPYAFRHHYYPRASGYVLPYWPYYYGGYAPYASDYGEYPGYTGYIAGTFDTYSANASPQYAPPANYYPPPENAPPPAYQSRRSSQSSDEFAEPTVLVFRDGHRQEISNYAIMGSTLFILSGPRARIPIAELDIPATERINQSRGIDFHVPKKTP